MNIAGEGIPLREGYSINAYQNNIYIIGGVKEREVNTIISFENGDLKFLTQI